MSPGSSISRSEVNPSYVERQFGYVPTPPAVLERLLELADVQPDMRVLEPSAGEGAIAGPLTVLGALVTAIELDACRADRLRLASLAEVCVGDFLAREQSPDFDRVVMNPPFATPASKWQDLIHVRHAFGFLKPGGRLVAVMAAGSWTIDARSNHPRPAQEFRDLIAAHGFREDLPAGSFKPSGTGVRTVVVVLDAPRNVA